MMLVVEVHKGDVTPKSQTIASVVSSLLCLFRQRYCLFCLESDIVFVLSNKQRAMCLAIRGSA